MLVAVLLCSLQVHANITFKFAARTIEEGDLKTRMENNISALMSEINRAGSNGDSLNLSGISMEQPAKDRLKALWNDSPFVFEKSTIISKCVQDFQGYQVRAIPVTMKPQNSSYDQTLNRELTISLNKNGEITGVRPTWEKDEDVNKILTTTGAGGIMETRMRREMLKWIEDLKSLYAEKNVDALEEIFSSAISVPYYKTVQDSTTIEGIDSIGTQVYYNKQTAQNYISQLRSMFVRKKPIDVEFDHISVMKHWARPNIYGVIIHQSLQTDGYNIAGWLFTLWDFNNPEKPKIHVTTWQTDEEVAKDGVFTLEDFFIP